MFNSVRTRLTLWYAAVLALVLIAFALVVYFLVAQTVSRITENAMRSAGDALTGVINTEKDEDDESKSNADIFNEKIREDFRFRDLAFVIYDEQGNVIAESFETSDQTNSQIPQFKISAAQIPPEAIEKSAAENFQTFPALDETKIKIYAQKIDFNGQNYTIAVLHPLTEQSQLLEKIRFIFFLVIPLVLLAAIFGGYYLARKSLAPVVEMSEKAALIGSTNLNERLPVADEKDELGELAAAFNGLLARLEKSFEQQKRFMADASHELRTPLAIVRGEAEVALSKEDRPNAELRESLGIVQDEGIRLTRIVEDLFTLARVDAGQFRANFTEIYLDELLTDCVRKLRVLAEKRNISLEMKAAEEMPMRGDEQLLHRLFINLLDNAIKYNREGGSVSVKAEKTAGEYRVTITDTGAGISEDEQPQIFERFYRADKARSRMAETATSGAGLGLSIAQWIAKTHHAELELIRSDETGSVFSVIFSV